MQAQERRGGTSGGGGGSLVCFDSPDAVAEIRASNGMIADSLIPRITFIETYDLAQLKATYEPGVIRPEPFPTIPGEGPHAYMERLARRYDYTATAVSELIRRASALVQGATTVKSNSAVIQVNDANPVFGWDVNTCALITTIHQNPNGDRRLTLTKDIRLIEHPLNSEISVNLMYLHEGLHAIGRERGQRSSDNVREFISLIAQKEVRVTTGQLLARAQNLGLLDQNGAMGAYLPRVVEQILPDLEKRFKTWGKEFTDAHSEARDYYFKLRRRQLARVVTDFFHPAGWIDLSLFRSQGCPITGINNHPVRCMAEQILERRRGHLAPKMTEYIRSRALAAWNVEREKLFQTPQVGATRQARIIAEAIENSLKQIKCDMDDVASWYISCEFSHLPIEAKATYPQLLELPAVLED